MVTDTEDRELDNEYIVMTLIIYPQISEDEKDDPPPVKTLATYKTTSNILSMEPNPEP